MLAFLAKGGPVMILLLGLSVISLAFGLERFYHLNRARKENSILMKRLQKALAADDLRAAIQICASFGGPVAAVLKGGLDAYESGIKNVERGMAEAQRLEFSRLEKHLDILALAANLAPLLGLLGTVTGMIDTFAVFSAQGAKQPMLLARGISEALITTASGLVIAIVNMAIHHHLTKRVDELVLESESYGVQLQDLLAERKKRSVPTKTATGTEG